MKKSTIQAIPKMLSKYKEIFILLSCTILLRILFLYIQPDAAFSNDLASWLYWIDIHYKGQNPYTSAARLNYPPVWLQILLMLSKISVFVGISFSFCLQLFLILTELCMIFAVYTLGTLLVSKSVFKYVFYGLVLNPISIYQVCQHGQFDILVSLSVIGAVFFLIKWQRTCANIDWLFACTIIGIGITTKIVPVLLTPLLLANVRKLGWKERILGAFLVFAPILFGLSILASVADASAFNRSIGYRSTPGYFGISGLLFLIGESELAPIYTRLYNLFCLAMLGSFSLWMILAKRITESDLILSGFFLFLTAITFSPGYGPQYIMWCLPLSVIVYMYFSQRWKLLLLATYAVAALTYTVEYGLFASHGAIISKLIESSLLLELGQILSKPSAQTLLRLPLFILYVGIWIRIVVYYASTGILKTKCSLILTKVE